MKHATFETQLSVPRFIRTFGFGAAWALWAFQACCPHLSLWARRWSAVAPISNQVGTLKSAKNFKNLPGDSSGSDAGKPVLFQPPKGHFWTPRSGFGPRSPLARFSILGKEAPRRQKMVSESQMDISGDLPGTFVGVVLTRWPGPIPGRPSPWWTHFSYESKNRNGSPGALCGPW